MLSCLQPPRPCHKQGLCVYLLLNSKLSILLHQSFFLSVCNHHNCNYCCFLIGLNIEEHKSANLFFKVALANFNPLYFHMNFIIHFFSFTSKQRPRILLGIMLNPLGQFGENLHFNSIDLLIHEHGMSLYLIELKILLVVNFSFRYRVFLLCPHMAGVGAKGLSGVSFRRVLIPFICFHLHDLGTFQRPNL